MKSIAFKHRERRRRGGDFDRVDETKERGFLNLPPPLLSRHHPPPPPPTEPVWRRRPWNWRDRRTIGHRPCGSLAPRPYSLHHRRRLSPPCPPRLPFPLVSHHGDGMVRLGNPTTIAVVHLWISFEASSALPMRRALPVKGSLVQCRVNGGQARRRKVSRADERRGENLSFSLSLPLAVLLSRKSRLVLSAVWADRRRGIRGILYRGIHLRVLSRLDQLEASGRYHCVSPSVVLSDLFRETLR